MNKLGADKVISVYWFLILLLVAGGIFAMVSVFYGHPYDIREVEAELLTNKVADCLSYGGTLDEELFNEGDVSKGVKDSFLQDCGINFNVEKSWENESQYYFKISFFNEDDLSNDLSSFTTGNLNLVASCDVQENEEFEKLAKCHEGRIYSTLGGEQYLVEIQSIVKKTEKNVK